LLTETHYGYVVHKHFKNRNQYGTQGITQTQVIFEHVLNFNI